MCTYGGFCFQKHHLPCFAFTARLFMAAISGRCRHLRLLDALSQQLSPVGARPQASLFVWRPLIRAAPNCAQQLFCPTVALSLQYLLTERDPVIESRQPFLEPPLVDLSRSLFWNAAQPIYITKALCWVLFV